MQTLGGAHGSARRWETRGTSKAGWQTTLSRARAYTAPRCRSGRVREDVEGTFGVARSEFRAVTLVLGEHEASVAFGDALAEVSNLHEPADAERC
jgi:hypothetical protein